MKSAALTIGVLLCVLVLASCKAGRDDVAQPTVTASAGPAPSTAPAVAPAGPARAAPGDEHWLQDEHLRDIMQRIAAKTQKYWPQEVPGPRDDQRTGDLEQAIDSARRLSAALAASAERIPVAVEHVNMTATDRSAFRSEADTLRRQALDLGEAAAARKPAEMQQRLDAITATCVSCHTRFRDVAGELKAQPVNREAARGERPPVLASWSAGTSRP